MKKGREERRGERYGRHGMSDGVEELDGKEIAQCESVMPLHPLRPKGAKETGKRKRKKGQGRGKEREKNKRRKAKR